MSAIRVDHLNKRYGDADAVNDVSFRVEPGEVYALLGHNGAGKSTTVEILEGHRTATSGDVAVLGFDPATAGREFRDRIGIVLQSMTVQTALTVRETVEFFGAAFRRRRATDELIELVGLGAKADERVGTLSGGQRRRLDLAVGIVGHPDLLFLDEPTTGFDPVARRQSWELVRRLCEGGTTVLLTTHYLDEAEHLADRVGVLANGELVVEGTPADLISAAPAATVAFDVPAGLDVAELALPADAAVADGKVSFTTESPTAALADIVGPAAERGLELSGLSVTRPNLEDVFLQLGDAKEKAS